MRIFKQYKSLFLLLKPKLDGRPCFICLWPCLPYQEWFHLFDAFRKDFASTGQNGIFDKPFVSYQWFGENCEIKFVEFVSVAFLTNPNLSSTKISKTKSTQIQIMKFNSNFEKTSFKIFFIFLHILHNLQIWAYILLFRITILFCQLEYSSFIFCTFIGIVPTALYTIKFFANFDFCFVWYNL